MTISTLTNQIESKDFLELVLFTSTFYANDGESESRSQLALDLIRNADTLGVRLIVADSSPLLPGESMSAFEKNVHDILGSQSAVSVIRIQMRLEGGTKSTMADERKQALEYGLDTYKSADYFLWLEPEKANLVTESSLSAIAQTAQRTAADFVIPAREKLMYILSADKKKIPDIAAGGMNTLPEFQARTETRANTNLRKDLGTKEYHDSFFGPVLLKRGTGTEQWLHSPHPQRGINVLTPIEGKKAGLSVASAPVDYRYDDRQRMFENGEVDSKGNPLASENQKKQAKSYKQKRLEQYTKMLDNK